MSVVAHYIDAFQGCYPHKTIEVKPKRVRTGNAVEIKFAVLIDNDAGSILLSEGDLRSATRLFKRGK